MAVRVFARMARARVLRPALVTAVVATLGGLIWVNRASFTPLDVGSRAPDYTAQTLSGEPVALSHFRGEVVVLNLWATWCAPCVREMPALQRLHEKLASEGLRIVAVNVDQAPSPVGTASSLRPIVRDFIDRFDLTFTVLRDPAGGIQRTYQSPGLPSTYVIDREGRIRLKVIGAAEWDEPELTHRIRQLLEA